MLEFLIQNAEKITATLTAVVTLASAVANLTPTDSDNRAVAALSKLVNILALNIKK